ncbi:hypothetical protein EPO15_17835 [bacterium]|nr:MAG: hypothetical protein EPO15_17835 [bacterium]
MRIVWAASAAAALALAPLAAFSAPAPVLVDASCFPNPFDSRRTNATVRWALAAPAPVEVSVHTVFGARVWRRSLPAGVVETAWDGTDSEGRKLGKGLYLLVLRSGGESRVVKVGVRR